MINQAIRASCLLLVLTLFSSESSAQDVPTAEADSSKSNYQNNHLLGGPQSIGVDLARDNEKKEPYFRLPVRVFSPWFDWKETINKDSGIQFGISYTSVFIQSSEVIGSENDKTAGGGILDFQLGWNAVNRQKEKNKGTLFLKINDRHGYGGDTAPMFHGLNESGYYGLPSTGYRDYSIRMNELNWQQSLANDRFGLVVGKLDATNYFNTHALMVPWRAFLNYGSSVSGTVNWPDKGLGVVAGFQINDNFIVQGALTDVRGDIYEDGEFLYLGENYDKGNFFKAAEVGYTPSMQDRNVKKVSIMFWQTDSYVSATGADIPSAQGATFSYHWFFKGRFAPYIRFGISDGKGENAFYKKDLQIGHGLLFRSHDLLGTAISVAEPNLPNTKNQMTAEVFYRFTVTEHLEITPSFQWVRNPALNPGVDDLNYLGIRFRFTL